MKTLIELYDERPLENILATEVFRPERTVFLAPPEIAENAGIADALKAFLRGRGIETRLEALPTDMNDPEAVRASMAKVLATWDDCALDICGGTDAALFAGGVFAAGNDMPVFTWSRKKRRFFNIRNAPFAEVDTGFVRFSIDDVLRMAGGSMRKGRVDNGCLSQYMWLMEPFFSTFMGHRKNWVHTVEYIQAVSQTVKGQTVSLHAEGAAEVKVVHDRVRPDAGILDALASIGMLSDVTVGEKGVSFTFVDGQIRSWLRDVGSVLELYVYKNCLDLGIYNDVRTSVIVDWAGRQETDGVSNEIDVVASRGLTPLFVSCKTGEVKTEALNELAILRDRFGGDMARAAVVTAENAGAALRNRAAQLRIDVIDLQDLQDGQLKQRLAEVSMESVG